ncbi:MAG: hypothetical protein H6Q78_1791 [Candidatus Krumholzibacteriota bacterium]|nr:hypothetical protein [Candidatus Krumholzibacteriota bacterium]
MAFSRRICWAVIAFGILAGPGAVAARTYGGGIGITTNASADSVTVGERLRVVHEITYPDSLTLLPPDRIEAGTCRLLSSEWKEEKKDRRVTATGRLEVVTTNLEKAFLPGMTFRFVTPSGDTLTARGDDVEAGVRRVTTEKSEPKPLKPQWQAPRGWGFLLWIAGALVLAALAFWLIRRRRRRPVAKPVEPELPADVVAYRRLDEIERMKLVEKGEIKPHYTLVVDALRSYLERRYLILALDQTTDEILRDLRRKNEGTAEIEPVLREADLVKFAKYKPEIEAAKRIIPAVRTIVAKTAFRPLVAAAPQEGGPGDARQPEERAGGPGAPDNADAGTASPAAASPAPRSEGQ